MDGRRSQHNSHADANPLPDHVLEPEERPVHNEILDTVQITPEHLRANGTIHVNPFAGIAEIVDNAVDSEARKVKIDYVKSKARCGNYLKIVDDGKGMTKFELGNVIRLGHSKKRYDKDTIGQFGNGLKSGAMRLGETLIVCTRQLEYCYNLLLISLKYLDDIGSQKCYVPMLTYELDDSGRIKRYNMDGDTEKQLKSLEIFCKYTPFVNEKELKKFIWESVPTKDGTCVVVADLKRLDNNEYEVLPSELGKDIYVKKRVVKEVEKGKDKKRDMGIPEEIMKESPKEDLLSRFLADLYLKPKLAIIINGHKLNQVDPIRSLADPRWSPLSKAGLDTFKEREAMVIRKEHKKLMVRHDELKQEEDDNEHAAKKYSGEEERRARAEVRKRREEIEQLTESMNILQARIDTEKEFVDIRVYLGIDVMRRCDTRAVFYTNGRRITSIPFITHGHAQKFKRFMGVVAIIDMPSTFLPTAQSREHYESPAEVDMMMNKLTTLAMQYMDQADDKYKGDNFWQNHGYLPDANPWDFANPIQAVKVLQLTGLRKFCCNCLEFRRAHLDKFIDPEFPKTLVNDFDMRPYRCGIDQMKDKSIDELLNWDPEKCTKKSEKEKELEQIPQMKITNKATYYHRDGAAVKIGNHLVPLSKDGPSTSRGFPHVPIKADSNSRSPSPNRPTKKKTRSNTRRDSSSSSASPRPAPKRMRVPPAPRMSLPSYSAAARLQADAERRRALAGGFNDDDDTRVERQAPTAAARRRNARAVVNRTQSPVLFHDPNEFSGGLQLGTGAVKDENERQPLSAMMDNPRNGGAPRQNRGLELMEESSESSDFEGDARPPTSDEETEDERLVQSPTQQVMRQVDQRLRQQPSPPQPPLCTRPVITEEEWAEERAAQMNRLTRDYHHDAMATIRETAELNVKLQRMEENIRRLANMIPTSIHRHNLNDDERLMINQIKHLEHSINVEEALKNLTRPEDE